MIDAFPSGVYVVEDNDEDDNLSSPSLHVYSFEGCDKYKAMEVGRSNKKKRTKVRIILPLGRKACRIY